MDNKNKLTKFNKVVFIACCIAFSILFSYFAIKYIDFKGDILDEERNYGDVDNCDSSLPGGKCMRCKSGYYASSRTINGEILSCEICPAGHSCNNSSKVECSAGKYQDEYGQTSCKTCPSGTYQSQSGATACVNCNNSDYRRHVNDTATACESCPAGTYSLDGKTCKLLQCIPGQVYDGTQCVLCEKGSYCFGSSTPCPNGFTTSGKGSVTSRECNVKLENISDCKVKLSVSKKRISVDSEYYITATLEGQQCSGQTLTVSSIDNKESKILNYRGNKTSEYSIKVDGIIHEIKVDALNKCSNQKIKVALTNGETVSISNPYITGKWDESSGYPKSGQYPVDTHPINSIEKADETGADVYYSDEKKCSWNENEMCYTKEHVRKGCGSSNIPPVSTDACYINKTTGKLMWGDYSSESGYEKDSNITKKEDCKNPSVDDCEDSIIIPTSETKKISCKGDADFKGTASKSCEINKSPYYKISCLEELSTDLVPGLTGTIKLGLGFNYNIKITSKRKCRGEFYFDKFMNAYDIVKGNLNTYPNGTPDYQTYLNKKNDLENMVVDYNKWASDYNLDNIKASLSDKQLDKSINFVVKKDSLKITRGEKSDTETHKLNIAGIDNPINFDYTETLSKELILPVAYYNQQTNTISYTNCLNCVEMSNQYFISNDKKYIDKDYKYEVVLTGLGYSKNWEVTTDDCSLNVKDDTKIYRPTDINDPFLNSANPERETGENWLNETFDFTKIIKSDTWQKKPLYEFNITTENVKEIKKNNSELGANAYLGLDCKLVTSRNKYYCEFLRNSKYFQYHYIYSDNLN